MRVRIEEGKGGKIKGVNGRKVTQDKKHKRNQKQVKEEKW